MSIQLVPTYDATTLNFGHLPKGQAAGYTTGGSDIAWTIQQFAEKPGTVRICQDAAATDHTADVLDVERGAATLADIPGWCARAHTSFKAVERPGQREPAIYSSASNITAVVNVLRGAKLTDVFLWVANWNLDDAQANADVEDASGTYPIIGVQWTDKPVFYDIDVFSKPWLSNVSHVAPTPEPGPYRHTTNGHVSGKMIADGRGEGFLSLLGYTAEHYDAKDMLDFATTLLPEGIPYYTRNP